MALSDELKTETEQIVFGEWLRRDGNVIPESSDIGLLGNECVELEATFLYADLADSTQLAIYDRTIASEICKAYLKGATRIIKAVGGHVRSFDGDRVMGVFVGDSKNSSAAKAGLQINHFFSKILGVAVSQQYPDLHETFTLKQTVGVDTSPVMVVRSGIRNSNDLIWVGSAPNVAAKLSGIRDEYPTYITKAVFDRLHESSRNGGTQRLLMWAAATWQAGAAIGAKDLYRSNWTWPP